MQHHSTMINNDSNKSNILVYQTKKILNSFFLPILRRKKKLLSSCSINSQWIWKNRRCIRMFQLISTHIKQNKSKTNLKLFRNDTWAQSNLKWASNFNINSASIASSSFISFETIQLKLIYFLFFYNKKQTYCFAFMM